MTDWASANAHGVHVGLMNQNIEMLKMVRAKQEALNIANTRPVYQPEPEEEGLPSSNYHVYHLNQELAKAHKDLAKVKAQSKTKHAADLEAAKAKHAAELAHAYKLVEEANDSIHSWQASMEAWQDLARTLRDEIKECPNHEAHKFGRDEKARTAKRANVQDERRIEFNLKPMWTSEEKGLV